MRPATDAPASLRALVVEDNRDTRETLQFLLRLWGDRVEAAADGRQGVDKGLAWRPEVAVVDIGLPLLDGYAVARQLRAALGAASDSSPWRAAAAPRAGGGRSRRASPTTSRSLPTPTNCGGCFSRLRAPCVGPAARITPAPPLLAGRPPLC